MKREYRSNGVSVYRRKRLLVAINSKFLKSCVPDEAYGGNNNLAHCSLLIVFEP